MSDRLVEMINSVILKEGKKGKLRLAMTIDRGEQMIDRYIAKEASPSQNNAYKLALACGCSEREALKIADECPPRGQRKA